jgi:hypothetical protein
MDLDEYLEKLAAEGYRQQLADEENVPRSLPFFAASLAVLVAILGAIREWIPAPEWAGYPGAIWGLLGAIALTLLTLIGFLGVAVRGRKFRYIMNEAKIAAYADQLLGYYEQNPNLTEAERKIAALEDLRLMLTRQYGEAAMYNRALNSRRAGARATAFEALIIALLLAFMLIAIIFWHGRPGDATGDRNVGNVQNQDRGSAQAGKLHGCPRDCASQADPATDPDHQERRVVVPAPSAGYVGPIEEKVNGAVPAFSVSPIRLSSPLHPWGLRCRVRWGLPRPCLVSKGFSPVISERSPPLPASPPQ